jgi:putative nucleotidyltransferase with HDIG domain
MRLLEINSNPEHSLQDVIDLVKLDSALTARTLRIVNSAAFNPLVPINSIDRAVFYLGEKMIVGIAVTESCGKMFNQPLEGYDSPAGDLWKHDLFTAFAAKEVARYAKNGLEADLAFTAGLLHDIGKPVLSKLLEKASETTIEAIDQGAAKDYLAAEKLISGVEHTEVGYQLALYWRLPVPIVAAVRYHHHPAAAEEEFRPLVYAVHLGDIIAMMSGYATGSDSLQYTLDSRYENFFNFSADELTKIISDTETAFRPALESLGGEERNNDAKHSDS